MESTAKQGRREPLRLRRRLFPVRAPRPHQSEVLGRRRRKARRGAGRLHRGKHVPRLARLSQVLRRGQDVQVRELSI